MARNPLLGWRLDSAEVRFVGRDLQRPECVLANRDGTVWTADARGGVGRIDADDGLSRLASGRSLPSFRSPVAGLPLVHWSER